MNANRFVAAGLLACGLSVSSAGGAETLDEVIGKALKENPQAIAGLNRFRAEMENVDVAWGDYLPTFDLSAGYGKQRRDYPEPEDGAAQNPNDGVTYTRKEASVTLRQKVFSGFNTSSSVKQARFRATAEQHRLQSTLQDLSLRISDVYIKVLERRDLLEQAEQNLKIHDSIYRQIEQRTRQGVSRSSDLTQIEGRRARANANLVNARNNLQDAESEYLKLVGSMPRDLQQPGSYKLEMPASFDMALQTAVKSNPGIIATDFDIKSAESFYSSQQSTFYPTLDLELDQSWRHNVDGQLGTQKDTTAMLRMRYNLFRGGSDRARLKESAFRTEESRAQRDRALRNVEETLRLAWAAYTFAMEQKEYLLQHETSSRETVEAYREQFNIGKRTLLDLLDSENELFQASQSFTRSIYQEAFARYRILAATGKILERLKVSLPEDGQ
ncbi:MAG: TolC family outer membrane protein [Endozoicomonas sp.]